MSSRAHLAVLVVEDEPLIRMVAADVLSELDAPVLEAGDADEAMLHLAAHPEIRLLVTDVNMPGSMDGLTLASNVHRIRPDIELIVTSAHLRINEAALPDSGSFLPKPYSPRELLSLAREKLADKNR